MNWKFGEDTNVNKTLKFEERIFSVIGDRSPTIHEIRRGYCSNQYMTAATVKNIPKQEPNITVQEYRSFLLKS